jgi:hypothetical protein
MPPRLRFAPLLLPAAIIVAIFAACDDPLGPQNIAGTYVLRSVRGDPLPAIFRETNRSQLHVLADTLYLERDGTGREVWLLESIGLHGSGPERSERELTFHVQGTHVEGSYPCGPLEICVGVITLSGHVTASGLRLEQAAYAEGPLVFERVDR